MSSRNITGRDAAIIRKALALAVAVAPYAVDDWLEHSDRDAMLGLLRARAGTSTGHLLELAERTLARIEDGHRGDAA